MIYVVEYIKAVMLPFSDWKKLGIGTLLGIAVTIVPLLNILVMLLISGYSAIIAKNAMNKKFVLPEWTKWGQIFIIGAKIFLISFVYMLIPTALLLTGLGSVLAGIGVGLADLTPELVSEQLAAVIALGGAGAILILLAIFLYLVAYYFLPMAELNFIAKGKVSAAFNLGEVVKKVMRLKYFISVLFLLAYLIVVGIVTGILNLLTSATVIGPIIVSGALMIILSITDYSVLGQVYAEK